MCVMSWVLLVFLVVVSVGAAGIRLKTQMDPLSTPLVFDCSLCGLFLFVSASLQNHRLSL